MCTYFSIATNAFLILARERERSRQLSISGIYHHFFFCHLPSLRFSLFILSPTPLSLSLSFWTGIFRAAKLIARRGVSLRCGHVTDAKEASHARQRIIKARACVRAYTHGCQTICQRERDDDDRPMAMGAHLTPNCGLRRLPHCVPLIHGRYGTRA